MSDTAIYDNNNDLKIPYQWSTAQNFVIDNFSWLSANADIDNIKGMPVGSQFKIQNDSSYDVTFVLTNFGSAVGWDIIDVLGTNVTLDANKWEYAVFEVREDYKVALVWVSTYQ